MKKMFLFVMCFLGFISFCYSATEMTDIAVSTTVIRNVSISSTAWTTGVSASDILYNVSTASNTIRYKLVYYIVQSTGSLYYVTDINPNANSGGSWVLEPWVIYKETRYIGPRYFRLLPGQSGTTPLQIEKGYIPR